MELKGGRSPTEPVGQPTAVEEAGVGGRACIFEERALEGIFEEWVLEDLTPPPCPAVPDVSSAHPQPRCRGRSSTPRSHCPRLAPSWWALSPDLAPDLTCWASGTIFRSVAWLCAGSQIAAGNGSLYARCRSGVS